MPKPCVKKILLLNDIIKPVKKKPDKIKKKPVRQLSKYSKTAKIRWLIQAFDLLTKGLSVREIASELRLPSSTIFGWISDDSLFAQYKKAKSKKLSAKFLQDIEKDSKRQDEIRSKATFSQLSTDIGIKWDKLFPPYLVAQQFNIGTKKIEVKMPSFFKPRTKK